MGRCDEIRIQHNLAKPDLSSSASWHTVRYRSRASSRRGPRGRHLTRKMMKLVVVGVLVLAAMAAADNCTIAPPARIDCKIDSQGPCEAAGCCWGPYNGHDPWCFKPYPASPPPPTPAPPPPLPGPPFNSTALSLMKTYLRANLDIKNLGGVVASPSTSGPGGSYYYACMHPTPNPTPPLTPIHPPM